jgi:hypothetical protein
MRGVLDISDDDIEEILFGRVGVVHSGYGHGPGAFVNAAAAAVTDVDAMLAADERALRGCLKSRMIRETRLGWDAGRSGCGQRIRCCISPDIFRG